VEEDFLFELISSTRSVMGGDIYIVDKNNRIVSSEDKMIIGDILPLAQENLSNDYSFATFKINGSFQYVVASESMQNRWKIVSCVPVAVYNKEINLLRTKIILLTIIILLASIIFAWSISHTIA
jgi:hypothetical protein